MSGADPNPSDTAQLDALQGHPALARWRFTPLLVALVALFVVQPFFEGRAGVHLAWTVILSLILLTAVLAVSRRRVFVHVGVALLTPGLVLTWLHQVRGLPDSLVLVMLACQTVFLAYTTGCALTLVLRAGPVTRDKLTGAVAVYMLLGVLWGLGYALLNALAPGSFSLGAESRTNEFVYYSFMTLTTVGYGDITPKSELARSFAILEALVGQVYLTILVARLVSLHLVDAEES